MSKAKGLIGLLRLLYALVLTAYDRAKTQVYGWKIIGRLMLDTRAESGGGMGAGVVGTIIGIMVSLLVAIIIIVNLVNSQTPDSSWTTEANATWAALQTNIWVALGLLVIVPIIIGAVIIMSYVRRGM